MGGEGFEKHQDNPGNSAISTPCVTKSVTRETPHAKLCPIVAAAAGGGYSMFTRDAALADVVIAWASLPHEIKQSIGLLVVASETTKNRVSEP